MTNPNSFEEIDEKYIFILIVFYALEQVIIAQDVVLNHSRLNNMFLKNSEKNVLMDKEVKVFFKDKINAVFCSETVIYFCAETDRMK